MQIDAFELINKVLGTVDWKKLHNQYHHKTLSTEQLKLAKGDYTVRMLEIADMLDGQGTMKHAKNKRLGLLLDLMHDVLLSDLPKTIERVKQIAPELKFDPDSNSVEQFGSICLLTGAFDSSSRSVEGLVKGAKKNLAQWMSE